MYVQVVDKDKEIILTEGESTVSVKIMVNVPPVVFCGPGCRLLIRAAFVTEKKGPKCKHGMNKDAYIAQAVVKYGGQDPEADKVQVRNIFYMF